MGAEKATVGVSRVMAHDPTPREDAMSALTTAMTDGVKGLVTSTSARDPPDSSCFTNSAVETYGLKGERTPGEGAGGEGVGDGVGDGVSVGVGVNVLETLMDGVSVGVGVTVLETLDEGTAEAVAAEAED